MTVLLIVLAAVIVAAAALLLAYVLYSGARVVKHGKPRYVDVSWDAHTATLPVDDETTAEGTYGLWVGDINNPGHLLIGPVDHVHGNSLTRPILASTDAAAAGRTPGRFVGHVFPGPEAIAPGRWSEISITTPAGECPAWLIRPEAGDGSTWAIHVHGIGAKRVAVLRSVPAAEQLGMTSLVPSFRGDGEGPETRGGASTLGQLEQEDIAAAIDYAAAHGAERIVIIAWSMGAAAAIPAITASAHPQLITALALIAPVTEWGDVIAAGAHRAHIPAGLAKVTTWGLQRRWVAHALGMDSPADFTALRQDVDDVLNDIPTLIIHSENDPLVPFSSSEKLVTRHPAVQLYRYTTPGHAWEYNPAPQTFTSALANWITSQLRESEWR